MTWNGSYASTLEWRKEGRDRCYTDYQALEAIAAKLIDRGVQNLGRQWNFDLKTQGDAHELCCN
jgi:hypothetical protein